jgi:hypothetical protein
MFANITLPRVPAPIVSMLEVLHRWLSNLMLEDAAHRSRIELMLSEIKNLNSAAHRRYHQQRSHHYPARRGAGILCRLSVSGSAEGELRPGRAAVNVDVIGAAH